MRICCACSSAAAIVLLAAVAVRAADTLPASQLIALPNARVPVAGLLTGGQPTAAQLEQAASAGFRTLINLRPDGEDGVLAGEAALARELGLRYVHIPIAGADGLTSDNARLLSDALAAAGPAPVLFHCASGNRVGALLALKAALVDGVPAEEALALGKRAGLSGLEAKTRELLGLPAQSGP